MQAGILVALGAALLLGGAAVLQHRAAATCHVQRLDAGRSLFTSLLRRPVWAAGLLLLIAGSALQAAALGMGRLLVIEPLAVTSLLFGLPISALWWRHRLRWRDWSAAVAVTAGVCGFLVLGHAHGGTDTAPAGRWLMAAGIVLGAALVAAGAARPSASLRPTGIALAAGMALGLSDGLTKTTVPLLVHHGVHVVGYWQPYALVGVALTGYLLLQYAYHHGHLAQCLPAAVLAQPVTGAIIGVVVLGERLQDGIPIEVGQALAVAVAAAAVVLLARSPRVAEFARPIPVPTAG